MQFCTVVSWFKTPYDVSRQLKGINEPTRIEWSNRIIMGVTLFLATEPFNSDSDKHATSWYITLFLGLHFVHESLIYCRVRRVRSGCILIFWHSCNPNWMDVSNSKIHWVACLSYCEKLVNGTKLACNVSFSEVCVISAVVFYCIL